MMRFYKFFIIISSLILANGCTSRYFDKKFLDIQTFRSSEMALKFDIRDLKEAYGEPPIKDGEKKVFGYYNIYETQTGSSIFSLKPDSSEVWYILLEPTNDENFYNGVRYYEYFSSERHEFTHGKPLTDIGIIMKKCKLVKPDHYFETYPEKKVPNKSKNNKN